MPPEAECVSQADAEYADVRGEQLRFDDRIDRVVAGEDDVTNAHQCERLHHRSRVGRYVMSIEVARPVRRAIFPGAVVWVVMAVSSVAVDVTSRTRANRRSHRRAPISKVEG